MLTGHEVCGPLLVGGLHGIDDEVGTGKHNLHNVAHSIVESTSAWTPKGALGDHVHDDQRDSCSFLCDQVWVLGKGIGSLEALTNLSQARLTISNEACALLESKLVDDESV